MTASNPASSSFEASATNSQHMKISLSSVSTTDTSSGADPKDLEILKFAQSGNVSFITKANLPLVDDCVSVEKKLDEGSSGLIIKVKSKLDRKYYVLKKLNYTSNLKDTVPKLKLESKNVSRSPSASSSSSAESYSSAKDKLPSPISSDKEISNERSYKPNYAFDSLNEYLIMKKVYNSKFICNVHKLLESTDKSFCLLLDYYINSDLLYLTTAIRKLNLSTSLKFKDNIFLNIVEGIKFLHNKNIVHRDIKPENILIDSNGKLRIADFGYAMDLNRIDDYPIDKFGFISKGTNSFKAPEILMFNGKTLNSNDFKAIDVWALGVLYYQLKFLTKPWSIAESNNEDFNYYKSKYELSNLDSFKNGYDIKRQFNGSNSYSRVFKTLKDDALVILIGMLNPNNKKRLIVNDIYRSDWLVQTRVSAESSKDKDEILKLLKIVRK